MKIAVHSTRGVRQFTFGRDLTAGAATVEAVRAFELSPDDEYGLLLSCNASTPLQNDRTLESYSILDVASLYFSATGCHEFYIE